MNDRQLDVVDRGVLHLLQRDGRATITEMAERLPVSGNTVSQRIRRLEAAGVIAGYAAEVDYGRAGLPFHWLFTCSASVAERHALAERALAVPGVVGVLELMAGERNVLVEVVGRDQDDLTRIARSLDDLGVRVHDETMLRGISRQPVSYFADSLPD